MMQALLEMSEIYWELNEQSQSFLGNLIDSMSVEQTKTLTDRGASSLASAIQSMLLAVSSDPEVQSAINGLMSLRANESNLSVGAYSSLEKQYTETIKKAFADMPEIDIDALLNVSVGAQVDIESILQEVQEKISDEDVIARIKELPVGTVRYLYQYGLQNVGDMSLEEFDRYLDRILNQEKQARAMDELLSNVSSLVSQTRNLSDAQDDYILISKAVNKEAYLTGEQVGVLCGKYPELQEQLRLTEQGWSLESGAMDVVQNSLYGLQSAYGATQAAMNNAVVNGVSARLKNLGLEISGIQAIINAYNSLSQSKAAVKAKVESQYKKAGVPLDNWAKDASGYYGTVTDANGNSAIIDKDTESMMKQVADAQKALDQAQSTIGSLSGKVGHSGSSSGGSSGGSGGSGSGSSTDKWLEAYEKERATLDYQREKDLINEQRYYTGIEALWQKYFKGKAKYVEKDRELDLELYKMRQSLAEDWISDKQHEIDMLDKRANTEVKQIVIYRQLMDKVHALANEARGRGLSDDDDYIQNLQKQWWEFSNSIDSLNKQMLDNALSGIDAYIEQMDAYETWGNDNAYEARKRYIELIDHAYKRAIISEEEYQERRVEAEKNAFEALKKIREAELDERKEATEAAISVVEDRIDREIEALEKQKQALQDKNDEEDRAIELQRLQDALDAAKRNRNRRVYYEDKGWVWEADQQAIADAQKELDDFHTDEAIREIEKQIDAWEEYKESFTKIPDEYKKAQDKLKAEMLLGYDWESDVVNKRIDLQEKLRKSYVETMAEMEKLNETVRQQVDDDIGLTEKDGSNWRAIVAINSEKWRLSNDPAEKAALHNENLRIYQSHGYEYDPTTGTYHQASGGGSSGSSKSTSKITSSGIPGGNSAAMSAISKVVGTTIGKALSEGIKKATKNASYSSGGVNDETGVAMLHGTKSNSEVIFNSADAKKLWNYVHTLNVEKLRDDIRSKFMPGIRALSPAAQSISEDNSITIQNLTVQANDANTLIRELKLLKNNR